MHKVSRRAGGAEPNRRWPDVVPFAELRSGVNRRSSWRPAGTGKFASSKNWCKCSRETGGAGLGRLVEDRCQPTAPSIWSSISRLSSSAYSIGSSRAMGSTKPRTMVAAASSSVMPRLIR